MVPRPPLRVWLARFLLLGAVVLLGVVVLVLAVVQGPWYAVLLGVVSLLGVVVLVGAVVRGTGGGRGLCPESFYPCVLTPLRPFPLPLPPGGGSSFLRPFCALPAV